VIHSFSFPYIRFPAVPTPTFPARNFVDRPALETRIEYQGTIFPLSFFSIIDSGADSCVFPSLVGEQIGIDIKTGLSEGTMGVAGSGITYYHSIKVWISIQGNWYHFDCFAGFMDEMDQFGMGLLGHHGFFSLFDSVTLDSKKKIVELKIDIP
jgi:hypothetical protein